MLAALLMCSLFLFVGAALSLSLRPWLPKSLTGWWAGAFLIGAGTTGFALFVVALIGVPVTRAAVLGLTLVALLLLLVQTRALRTVIRERTRGSLAGLVLLLIPFAFVLYGTWDLPIGDYDGRATWLPKTTAIAHEHSIRGPFFHGERGLNLHNHYPLLLPLDTAALMLIGHTSDVNVVRPLYLLLPFAFLLCACELARERIGNSALILTATAWLPPWIVAPEGGAGSAYADLTAAAFFGMAVLSANDSDERRGARTIGMWLAFLILTKNEGVALAVVLLGTLVLCGSIRRPSMAALIGAAPVFAIAALAVWRAGVPEAYDHRYGAEARQILHKLPRIGSAIKAFVVHACSITNWGFVWPGIALASVWNLMRRRECVAVLATFGAAFAYVLTYTVTTWNIDELARVSAHRLLTHLIVPGLFILASAAAEFLRYDRDHDADSLRR